MVEGRGEGGCQLRCMQARVCGGGRGGGQRNNRPRPHSVDYALTRASGEGGGGGKTRDKWVSETVWRWCVTQCAHSMQHVDASKQLH